MSLLWLEGFEVARDNTSMARRYPDPGTQVLNGTFVAGRLNAAQGGLAYAATATASVFRTPLLTTNATWVMGAAMRARNPVNGTKLFRLMSGSTEQASLRIVNTSDASYKLEAVANGVVVATSPSTFLTDVWYYFEFKVFIAGAGSGKVSLDANEATEFFEQIGNTNAAATGTADSVEYSIRHNGLASNKQEIDDMYVVNGAGSIRNDWLGDLVMEAIRPNGAVSATWTPFGDANNYACVDDVTPDDDTTYVTTNANNQKDLYQFSNLQFIQAGTPIVGVQVEVMARLLSAGSRNLKIVSNTAGGLETQGATLTFNSTAYSSKSQMWEQNPDGGGAGVPADWDVTAVNGHRFGFITVA